LGLLLASETKVRINMSWGKGAPHLGFGVIGRMRYLTVRVLAESREGLSQGSARPRRRPAAREIGY